MPDSIIIKEITIFRAQLHTIYTELKKKIALSFDDDKRFVLKNSSGKTLSWGHKDIISNEVTK
jgi:hypothetical protein